MGLRRRIVLPFLALFALAYAVTATISVYLATRAVERQLQEPARNLARLMGQFGWSSPEMLGRMKAAVGADIAVLVDGGLKATTLADGGAGLGNALRGRPGGIHLRPGGLDLLVVLEPTGGQVTLALIHPADHLAKEQGRVARPLILVALAGLGVVVLLGYGIAQTIAGPIERLALQAAEIAEGRREAVLPAGGGPEIEQLVAAFNRMVESIRRAERLAAMGSMAAGVAHEIRNPLAAMKMTVQMLLQEQQGKGREPYELLLREIERLDLVAGEFAGAGRTSPIRKTPARLDGIVDEVLSLLARQLEHLRITVSRDFRPAPALPVDPERIKRAVMNLVLNGAQSMAQGGTLTVAISPAEKGVRFSVADAGPGVPEELKGRLFEPFVTGKADGVGLGLVLTKKIAEDHGGRIGFDSSPRGATFWIDLPA